METTSREGGLILDKMLQFGHGLEAVETSATPHRSNSTARLQFGHGLEAVETVLFAERASREGVLQFGHGLEAVET